jgi:DNA (cytosine-5)-methyltransferase 1
MGVRRLTPRECERLQGFDDDWTRWGADGRELKDGPRYKMIGNAFPPVMALWMGKRIVAVDRVEAPHA